MTQPVLRSLRLRIKYVPRWKILYSSVIAAAILAACSNTDHVAAAKAAIAKGDYASAGISLRNALEQEPRSIQARVMFADVLERRHDRPGAEEQLRKALEYGGNADELTPRIALMMVDRGDVENVIRQYKDVRLKVPDADATLRGSVAMAMLALKREAQARQQVEGAADVPAVRLVRAQLFATEGKAKQALAILKLDDTSAPPPLVDPACRTAHCYRRRRAGTGSGPDQACPGSRPVEPWRGGRIR